MEFSPVPLAGFSISLTEEDTKLFQRFDKIAMPIVTHDR